MSTANQIQQRLIKYISNTFSVTFWYETFFYKNSMEAALETRSLILKAPMKHKNGHISQKYERTENS